MTEAIVIHPQPRAWLEQSVLHPFVAQFSERLHRSRYSLKTTRGYLGYIAHFAYWLTTERIELNAINERASARFLAEHLPRCRCAHPVRRSWCDTRTAIWRLLEALRAIGVIPAVIPDDDDIERELARFDAYMRDVRGLAASTRQQRRHFVGRFLSEQFPRQAIDIDSINPRSVRRFILDETKGWCPGTVALVGNCIRSWLKYRAMSGGRVAPLVLAIPRIADWRLAALPDAMSDAETEQLLDSFQADFPSRRRAYAIVRCLTDLGLRSSEVVNLQLNDIDWQAGTIRLTGTKNHKAAIMPLPVATGRAIADYLKTERPTTRNRAVFVRHVAPYDLPLKRGLVSRVVVDAYRRCGWQRTRVHAIRHSVASRLLRAGTPMKGVADLLRHRSIDTSAIYTKIDMTRLAAVAMPWPGSVS